MHWLNQHLLHGWTKRDVLDAFVAVGTILLATFTARVASKTSTLSGETKDLADATRAATKAEDDRLRRQLDAQAEERQASEDRRRSNLLRAAREELTVAVEVLASPTGGHAWTTVAHDLLDNLISSDVQLEDDDAQALVRTVGAFRRYNALASMHNTNQMWGVGAYLSELQRLSAEAKAAADECVLIMATYVGPPAGFDAGTDMDS